MKGGKKKLYKEHKFKSQGNVLITILTMLGKVSLAAESWGPRTRRFKCPRGCLDVLVSKR